MQTKCWPRVQSRKTDSSRSLQRVPFQRAGRAGTDVGGKKERGGRNLKKKNWDEIHSLGAGPCLPLHHQLLLCQGLSCSGELAHGIRVCLSCMCASECVFQVQGSWVEA